MNDAMITVVGNVAAEPRYLITKNGTPLLSLRLASTPRRFDRDTGQWRDGDTMFLTVTCWRSLAANAQEALRKGDPVVVTGRLRLREYERDGERRLSVEVDASTVGHDLGRGVARFDRARRSTGATAEDRQVAAELAGVWETSVDREAADGPTPDGPTVDREGTGGADGTGGATVASFGDSGVAADDAGTAVDGSDAVAEEASAVRAAA